MKSCDKITAFAISLFCCFVVGVTLNHYGVTWDEGGYILSGESYAKWLENPSNDIIDKYWENTHEHPPFYRIIGGITSYCLFKKFKCLDRISAFRISILLFVFVLNYSLFCFSSELYGSKIALIIVLSFFFLPRIFFHSHLAALDYPVTAMWFLVIYIYWKGRKGGQRWVILAAFILGFALLTKLNSVFLYIPIILCWLFFYGDQKESIPERKGNLSLYRIGSGFSRLLPMFIIPPIVFFALWPWLWKNTIERVTELIFFHLHHFEIPVFYLWEQYIIAPWHYALVLTVMTVPLIILTPLVFGIFSVRSINEKKTNAFLLFNAIFPILIASLPGIPKYDGVRHFLPAFPFLCMLSGIGVKCIYKKLQKRKCGKFWISSYLFLFLLSIYFSVVKIHPFQSSYFSELAGGINGAAKKGFEIEYWGNAYLETLGWLNHHSDSSFWLCMTAIDPKAYFPFAFYKEMGLLSIKVRFTSKDKADYAILLIRQGLFDNEMWEYFLTEEPVFSVKTSNTPLVGIYKIKK